MILSIITINRNNSIGLQKTMESVLSQTFADFEYVVVDGASTDGSIDVIRRYENQFGRRLLWVSEPDSGIYNAMNKGIGMASGRYIQILNSGDCLADSGVLEAMVHALNHKGAPAILYGNMVKLFPDGRRVCDKCFEGQEITMLGMYSGTLNHDPALVRRDLFNNYGLYDESLKICSDWAWYLKAIVIGGEDPVYVDRDVTVFDMSGISEDERHRELISQERRQVLEKILPGKILSDYDKYSQDIYMMRRIRRHKFSYASVHFIERVLFKLEKARNSKKKVQRWG